MEKQEHLSSDQPPSYGSIEAHHSEKESIPMSKLSSSAPKQENPPATKSAQRNPSLSQGPKKIFITPKVGSNPTEMICPNCRARIVTRVDYAVGMKTHLMASSMCICCLILCAYIPYLTNLAKIPLHYCPLCDEFLGSYDNC